MKKCPACQTLYADDALSFCLTDGAALQYARDPDETLPAYDPNATLAYPPPQATQPNTVAAQPTPPDQMVIPVSAAPPTIIKQGVSPVIVGALVGLLILALGGLAAFILKDNWATPTVSPTPTPVAVVVATPQTQPTAQRETVVVKQPAPVPTTQSQPQSAANNNTNAAPDNDLAGRNCYQLKIMRNEMFARHGFIFKTPDMADYFSRQPWYRGTTSDVSGLLSPTEKRNITRIQRYENSLGCR